MSLFSAAYIRGLACAPFLILLACATDPKGTNGANGGGGTCQSADCSDGGASGGQSGGQNQNGSSGSNGELPDGGDPGEVVDCAKVEVEAKLVKKPVDIIWAVDSSGSMSGEAAMVQANMNSFAASIAASGLDYRVVVITKQGFLNVPDPLGSDPAHFLFIDENVGSHEPLHAFINRYADYESFLRPGAVTHLVPVTDDEARKQGNIFTGNREARTRDWFLDEMSKLLKHDFTLHAVASESPKCSGAANAGVIYNMLAMATSGLTFSICSADWSLLFTQLSNAVTQSSGVSCSIPMPEPPDGLALNPEQVKIGHSQAGGAPTGLMRVAAESACVAGGWYFDRPLLPRFIELCPDTCTQVNADAASKLNVSVDCGSNACAGVDVQADVRETPVDIIWVIDSSGSMNNEAKIVQDNLNDFAQDMATSGIDYRVVVITTEDFVYVPEPLRSDTAHLRFIEDDVRSDEALDDLLKRHADYADFLRPNAVTHIITVTDDEARREGADAASTASWFIAQMEGKLGHPFTLHAIVSQDTDGKGTRCTGPNGNAAKPGLTYIDLAATTNGQFYSICTSDWNALFDGLVRAVLSSSPIECSFDLPAAPAGKTFNKDEVNVRFAANGANEVTIIGRAPGADQCQAGGWYYDDANAPKRIQICDTTCAELRKQFDGAIEIQLGCETEVVLQ